jgi:hypothetical protein
VATFTFGDALLSILEIALLFLWIWVAITVVFDIFRSHDLSNLAKALWILLIVVFPLIGVLGYLIVRGHSLHEHQAEDRARYAAFQALHSGVGAPAAQRGASAGRRGATPTTCTSSPTCGTEACSQTRSSSGPRRRSCSSHARRRRVLQLRGENLAERRRDRRFRAGDLAATLRPRPRATDGGRVRKQVVSGEHTRNACVQQVLRR